MGILGTWIVYTTACLGGPALLNSDNPAAKAIQVSSYVCKTHTLFHQRGVLDSFISPKSQERPPPDPV